MNLFAIGQINHINSLIPHNEIHLPEFYKAKGIVFSDFYKIGIELRNIKNRFTPQLDDIIKAENILNSKSWYLKTINKNWVRQYVGLIDSNGKKNIIIQLINNSNHRKLNKMLGKNWTNDFVVMLSDEFYKIHKLLRINIDTGEILDYL